MKYLSKLSIMILILVFACKNRDINEGDQFRPHEIHDNYASTLFTRITIDGVDYLLMERDNNNPHEGFGFMAFRANDLIAQSDSSLAYLKAMNEMQSMIYARLYNVSLEQALQMNQKILDKYLKESESHLNQLKQETYMVVDIIRSKYPKKEKNED